MESSLEQASAERIANLLSDAQEIYASPAVRFVAHQRIPNVGEYESNAKLLENFSNIMEDWSVRQPMVKRNSDAV